MASRGGFRGGRGGFGGRGGYSRPNDREVTTKLFIGNVPPTATREELVAQFEKYGPVVEGDIVSNYAFVHYAKEAEAQAAKDGMHGFLFQGNEIRVEISRSRVRQKPGMGTEEACYRCGKTGHWSSDCRNPDGGRGGSGGFRGGGRGGGITKLFVGSLPESATNSELREHFSKHGKVTEADVISNYGFVHYSTPEEAETAVAALNQSIFKGEVIKVELSRPKVRPNPGMGNGGGGDGCFRCGSSDHWSKECPGYPSGPRGGGPGGPRGGFRPPPPRGGFNRRYSPEPPIRDRYRDRYSPYPDPYERRRAPLPPPMPPRERDPYSRDPYERPPPDYYRRSPERDTIDEYAKRRADEAYIEFYKYYSGRPRETPPSLPPSLGVDEPRLPPRERLPTPPRAAVMREMREPMREMREPRREMREPMREMREPIRDMREMREPMREMREPIREHMREPLIGSRPIPQQSSNYTDFSGLLNNLLHQSL